MQGIDKMQLMNFDFDQFVQYYNSGQMLLLNDKVPVEQKRHFLELIYGMTVITKTVDEDKKHAELRLSLLNQIASLTPEIQRKNR